jgi:hypothetical protein
MFYKLVTVMSFLSVMSVGALAQGVSQGTAPTENRSSKRMGVYVGVLGDPHPTLAGVNLAYNLSPMMRASVGYGKVTVSSAAISITDDGISGSSTEESMTTLGAAMKFLVPGMNLSPSATVGYSHIALSDNLIIEDYKANNFYLGLGADWQGESGLNLGAGMNLSMNGAAPSAPYFNLGYFF